MQWGCFRCALIYWILMWPAHQSTESILFKAMAYVCFNIWNMKMLLCHLPVLLFVHEMSENKSSPIWRQFCLHWYSSKRYISMCPIIILMRKECIRKREHTTSLQVGSSKKHSDFPKPVGNEANTWRPCKTAFVTCICSFFRSDLEHVWRMWPKCIVIAICSVPILFIMPAKFISRKLWLTWKYETIYHRIGKKFIINILKQYASSI